MQRGPYRILDRWLLATGVGRNPSGGPTKVSISKEFGGYNQIVATRKERLHASEWCIVVTTDLMVKGAQQCFQLCLAEQPGWITLTKYLNGIWLL
ncbi:hypothetical protein PMM47T1_21628 [Pseudomonas sp. M47T1]|nr:hypothetical protein PMM47T1_21628 [Pseudomonas sp. M47T1]